MPAHNITYMQLMQSLQSISAAINQLIIINVNAIKTARGKSFQGQLEKIYAPFVVLFSYGFVGRF